MTSNAVFGLVSAQVLRNLGNHPRNNVCPFRFPDRPPTRARLRALILDRLRRLFGRRGLALVQRNTLAAAEAALRALAEVADGLEETYARLNDDVSRQTMVEVLTFRVLGSEHVQLSLNTKAYWDSMADIEMHLNRGQSPFYIPLLKTHLQKYDLTSRGLPLALYSLAGGVYIMFFAEQYACRGESVAIAVEEGDVVVNGGGCWGDSALYFANRAGASGRVVSFEFDPDNLGICQENLKLNPSLQSRITIEKSALWDTPGHSLTFSANGPATRVGQDAAGSHQVLTTTIDRLVNDGEVARVDFIKLDVEGAELRALRGAEESIRRFRPKLAVCVYHDLKDFVTIPAYLASLDLGYRFYLRHFTIHAEETVLYADARHHGPHS